MSDRDWYQTTEDALSGRAPTSTAITVAVDDEQLGTALSLRAFLGTLPPGIVSPVLFGAALDVGATRSQCQRSASVLCSASAVSICPGRPPMTAHCP
jgi:hypothetical protein